MLVPSLKDDDLPCALAWARDLIATATHDADFTRKSLADDILIRAWDRQADGAIREAVVDYVQVCLAKAGDLMRGTKGRAEEAFQQRRRRRV